MPHRIQPSLHGLQKTVTGAGHIRGTTNCFHKDQHPTITIARDEWIQNLTKNKNVKKVKKVKGSVREKAKEQ